MTRQEFIDLVEQHCSEPLQPFVSMGVEALGELAQRDGQYYQSDMQKVIQYIGRLASSRTQANEQGQIKLKLTAEDMLTSDFLAFLLSHEIKRSRRLTFGSDEPPFKGYEEAIKWIESQDANLSREQFDRLERRHLKLFLRCLDRAGKISSFYPRKGSKLLGVITAANTVSIKTGLTPASVAMYILADIKPILLPYLCGAVAWHQELSTEGGPVRYLRRQVTIKVNAELDWNELRGLYRSIRRHLGVTRNKTFSSKHLELYQTVQKKGEPPKGKGTVSFWNSIMDDWNKSHDKRYGSWKAVKMAYDRVFKKLESRFQVEPVNSK